MFEEAQNYNKYKDFLFFESNFKYEFKGIDLVKVSAIDFINFIAYDKSVSLGEIAYLMFKELDVHRLKQEFFRANTVFTMDLPKRKDHMKLIKSMQEGVDDSSLHVLKYRFRPYFYLYDAIQSYVKISKSLIAIKLSLLQKVFIALRLSNNKHLVKKLKSAFKSVSLNGKNYVPFISSTYTEALLTAFLRKEGLKTFHISHGLFGRYKRYIAKDILTGTHVQAEYVITLGEIGKHDLINDYSIPEDKIFVAGNPKYPLRKIELASNIKNCLVLNGIALYDEDFEKVLPILEEAANLKKLLFEIKLHPLSKLKGEEISAKYKNIKVLSQQQSVQELLISGRYDFAVTFNTFAYYECMYYGVVPLRWGLNENLDFEGLDDRFYNLQDFLLKLERYNLLNKNELKTLIEDLLVRALGMGINKYNEIINHKCL